MRGRDAAVSLSLLLVLFASPIAQSQCPWTPRTSTQFRTTALDVAVDGNFVWVATSYGVQLLEQNRIVASVAIPGTTRVIAADGSGLAYAGSGTRLVVLRREGKNIRVIRSISTSGAVNDIVVTTHLFVATSNGIDHFDRIDPENPQKTSAFLATSSPNVTSLAIGGTTLYAADGDTSLETFSIASPSIPQGTGTIDTVRAGSVHVTANGLVLASDNLRRSTDVFANATAKLARLPFATTSVASSASAQFVAGPDRTLNAVDLTNISRVAELMELQLPPTDGTDNTIHAIERSGNTLYVAAGDIGLVTVDVSAISKPWPLASYAAGATNAVRAAGDRAWFTDDAGKVYEEQIVGSGLALTDVRSWAADAGSIVRDVQDQTLLTSAGSSATLWNLAGPTPAATATVTFSGAVMSAVLRGNGLVALLADGTVWTAQPSAAPVRITTPKTILLARNGSAIALAAIDESAGKTTVRYFASGDLLAAETRQITIDGTPVGNLALSVTRAAMFTFKGINIADLSTGVVTVIAGSNTFIPRQLAFAGDTLLAADVRKLLVYENARTLVRQQTLTANVNGLDASSAIAIMATNEGMAASNSLSSLPSAAPSFSSSHYTKLAATTDRAYLFSDEGIDVFRIVPDNTIQYLTAIPAQGIIDIAASPKVLYTLGGNGTVTAYSRAGGTLAQVMLSEGEGSQPSRIATVSNAVWVSFSKGCSSGTCEKKTLVLDPNALTVTSSMTAGVDDVVTSGNRAYALVDQPREVRIIDITDALHPSVLASANARANDRSIAAAAGKVFVLGERVFTYSDPSLTAGEELLTTTGVSDATQIRVDGNCALISGRSENAEQYRVPAFTVEGTPVDLPSTVRSFVVQPGRVLLLTAHSLEIWNTSSGTGPSKSRAVN